MGKGKPWKKETASLRSRLLAELTKSGMAPNTASCLVIELETRFYNLGYSEGYDDGVGAQEPLKPPETTFSGKASFWRRRLK